MCSVHVWDVDISLCWQRSVWGFVHRDAGFTETTFFQTVPFKNLLKQLGKTASAEEIMSGLADGAVVRLATFRKCLVWC